MSYYVFNAQESAIDACAMDDTLIIHDTSIATIKKVTVAQLLSEVITAASTAAAITATGITTIASTATVAYTLATPVAGMKKTFVTTAASTNARTVAASTGAITIGSTGATTLTFGSTAVANQAVVMVALSATNWGIVSNVGSVTLA